MKSHEIIFTLNDAEKIIIKLNESLDQVDCCYSTPIFFIHEKKEYLLSIESIRYNLHSFVKLFSMALEKKLYLHESIKHNDTMTKDIGWLYNEELQQICGDESKNRPYLIYEKREKGQIWVGDKYRLWSHIGESWIYNNPKGAIIFEITCKHPSNWEKPEEGANTIPYDEWISNYYRPVLLREIPDDIAQTWLTKAHELLNHIEENIQKDFQKRMAEGSIILD